MAGRQKSTAWDFAPGLCRPSAYRVGALSHFLASTPGLREPAGSLTPRYFLPPLGGAFFAGVRAPAIFESVGRQTIAGGGAAAAA